MCAPPHGVPLCVLLSQLEACTAVACALGRTLVLPRALCPNGIADTYFDLPQLEQLLRTCTVETMLDVQRRASDQAEVATCRMHYACDSSGGHSLNAPWWRQQSGHGDGTAGGPDDDWHRGSDDLLEEITDAAIYGCGDDGRGGSGNVSLSTRELECHLDEPLRDASAVRSRMRPLRHAAVVILAIDAASTCAVAPSAILDAGQRALVSHALRPGRRLRTKLLRLIERLPRPCGAVRACRVGGTQVAAAMATTTRVRPRLWLHAPSPVADTDEQEDATAESAEVVQLVNGEDATAAEVLRMALCAFSDYYIGASRSLDSEWVRRFRVSGCAKFTEHVLLPVLAAETSGDATVKRATHVRSQCCRHSSQPAERWRRSRCQLTSHNPTISASAVSVSLAEPPLSPQPQSPQPRLSTLPPAAAAWTPPAGLSASELFDHFIMDRLPVLRRQPLRAAPPGSTDRVALIVEPRCHAALEHVVRNASHFLGETWQIQIVHGTRNAHLVRDDDRDGAGDDDGPLFSSEELSRITRTDLRVDDLSRRAYSELLCSHWLWRRVVAERVLIFQTDALLCRCGVEEFDAYDYVGAPWRLDLRWTHGVPWLAQSGNGGLSLRTKSAALAMLDAIEYSRGEAEDMFFVEHTSRVGGRLAPRHVAASFSVEAVDDEGGGARGGAPPDGRPPFGMHAAHKYLPAERLRELLGAIKYE